MISDIQSVRVVAADKLPIDVADPEDRLEPHILRMHAEGTRLQTKATGELGTGQMLNPELFNTAPGFHRAHGRAERCPPLGPLTT